MGSCIILQLLWLLDYIDRCLALQCRALDSVRQLYYQGWKQEKNRYRFSSVILRLQLMLVGSNPLGMSLPDFCLPCDFNLYHGNTALQSMFKQFPQICKPILKDKHFIIFISIYHLFISHLSIIISILVLVFLVLLNADSTV